MVSLYEPISGIQSAYHPHRGPGERIAKSGKWERSTETIGMSCGFHITPPVRRSKGETVAGGSVSKGSRHVNRKGDEARSGAASQAG
jgi:hypothetical protein